MLGCRLPASRPQGPSAAAGNPVCAHHSLVPVSVSPSAEGAWGQSAHTPPERPGCMVESTVQVGEQLAVPSSGPALMVLGCDEGRTGGLAGRGSATAPGKVEKCVLWATRGVPGDPVLHGCRGKWPGRCCLLLPHSSPSGLAASAAAHSCDSMPQGPCPHSK